LRGVSTLTALALTVELGDWTRRRSALSSDSLEASTPAVSNAVRAGSPRPATATPAGCLLRRPGRMADRCGRAPRSPADGRSGRSAVNLRGQKRRRAPYAPKLTPTLNREKPRLRRRQGVSWATRSSRPRKSSKLPLRGNRHCKTTLRFLRARCTNSL
jgi:hypothetical protein